ncbi:MAG: EAL domain-containing protein [Pseudomonadota bacterium]|nr:EAL domain-containing protein [Pseudomonadota bacterium]
MLVITGSQDHVEAINGALRKAGYPVHCTWLADLGNLADSLARLEPDMLIAFVDEAGVDLPSIMRVRGENAAQMPVLVVRENIDETAIAEALSLGAQDAVSLANRGRLQSVAARELRAYRLERALSTTLSSAQDYRQQLQHFLAGSADAITQVQEGIIVDANQAWLDLFGHTGTDPLSGTPLMDLFEAESHPALKGALAACLLGKWTDHVLKVRALLADGAALPLELEFARSLHDAEPAIRISIPARPKTDLDLHERLAATVKNDASTGFLQQRHWIAAVRERCADAVKGGVRRFAHIGPDRFSTVQRTIGVLAGEEFMAQLGDLLRAHLTSKDICGRFGGTGVLVLLERGTPRDVEAWAESLVKRVSEHTFKVDDTTLSATVTVGLGSLSASNPDIGAAVDDALGAGQRGTELGGNRVQASTAPAEGGGSKANDASWVKQIQRALMENRFRLVQQPVASLLGEDKGMFDVLVRMLDEHGGEILPAEFIAAAERNNLMKNIDRWVIGASMAFAANRDAACIFVRLSKDTVLDPHLDAWLDLQLRASKIEAGRLCMQVTEKVADQHIDQTQALAGRLQALGFRFAIEHFGAGRDPMNVLNRVGMNFIKIDGSLMQGLSTNQLQQQRVKGLVDAAKQRGISTVAERVEDANTMAVLWQLGFDLIQGYFINAPEDVDFSIER